MKLGRAIRAAVVCVGMLAGSAAAETVTERPDLAGIFAEHNARGTFVLLDAATDTMTVFDHARAERRMVPASTFKIPNSLIALETGVVKDENEVIPFGGKPQPVKDWERDMGLRDAIRISNVPVYQEVARRVGLERMQAMVDRLGYGNRKIGTVVDRFWLDGPLAISAMEQARFQVRLARQELPVSARSQTIVRGILRLDEANGAVLFGKTGWTGAKPGIGWLVGWVERGGAVHGYALNIDMTSVQEAPKRLAIVKAMLERLRVY